MKAHIGIALAALLAASGPGMAEPQAVAAQIGRPVGIHVLSPSDHDLFMRAFAAAASGQWAKALALGDQGQDTVARQLLQWRYALDRDSGAKFADIDAVLKMAGNWPGRASLYARAEAAITRDLPATQIVQWFGARTPASPIGSIRLGEALIATGDRTRGLALVRKGWSEGDFDPFTETDIVSHDTAYLTPEADRARLDTLLWLGDLPAAKRQMARVDRHWAQIARARMALQESLKRARAALAALPESTDPGLLFDWARALRLDHRDAEAHAMLLRIAPETLARDHPQRWWNEVAIEARDAMADGNPRLALQLVDRAAIPPGGQQYVDQQFLGGFILLRLLKEPERALACFQRLGANVTRPISKSRAEYWQGRAYEAMGDKTGAYTHYRLAAAYPDTFYGQLAIPRTERLALLHITDTAVDPVPKSEIQNDLLMPEIRVLADLDQETYLRLFAEREGELHPAPAHLKQFLQSLSDWGYGGVAVRVAKQSGYAGMPMLTYAYPVLALPAYQAPGRAPDPALVLALIRQETEFDPEAVSSAGAMGLMQVMLSAAKASARTGGLRYRPSDLLVDTNYNIQLGMIEFAGNYASAQGSLVMAIASYNAGRSNVRKWLAANGDPRNGGVDMIDWIEEIPFGETRNYVERVMENMEVYKNRLAGQDMPVSLAADLYAPAPAPSLPVLAPPRTN